MEKASVLVTILAVIVNAEMETLSTQVNNRSPLGTKHINQLPTSPKQEVYYQPMHLQPQYQQPQPPQQYFPVQLVQAPFYHNQQQQPQAAMIIIAQPAVVPQPQPQQIIYPSATQQLLNYFNSNPQAKYQLLQNYQQQQQQQQHQQQPYVAQAQATNAQPAVTYQIMPQSQPQYQLAPVTQLNQVQPLPHPPADSTVQPQQISYQAPYQLPNFSTSGFFGPLTGLGSISTLAQLTAQKYLPPFRSPAPIITGLENFTPEQQAQIKAQLNSGGPITPLQSNALTGGNLQLAKTQQQPQATAQHTGPQEFTPSEEDKTSSQGQVQVQSPSTNYNSGVLYRNQFNKG